MLFISEFHQIKKHMSTTPIRHNIATKDVSTHLKIMFAVCWVSSSARLAVTLFWVATFFTPAQGPGPLSVFF